MIAAVTLFIFSTVLLYILRPLTYTQQKPIANREIPTPQVTPLGESPTPIPQEPDDGTYKLVWNDKNGTKTIFSMNNYNQSKPVRWQNYVFFSSDAKETADVKTTLNTFNIDTGEVITLFTGDTYKYINDIQIINDTLYFSEGGYMAQGGTYWLTLPFTQNQAPNLLAQTRNAHIQFIKERYWIIGGEGDACWGSSDYSLLDIATKKVTHILTTHDGCNEGYSLAGMTDSKMYLLYHHTEMDTAQDMNTEIYTKLSYIEINNPKNIIELIPSLNIDATNTQLYFSDTNKTLLMRVKDILYGVRFEGDNQNTLVTIGTVNKESADVQMSSWENQQECILDVFYAQNKGLFNENETQKAWANPEEACTNVAYTNKYDIKSLIENLNLPTNYAIIE